MSDVPAGTDRLAALPPLGPGACARRREEPLTQSDLAAYASASGDLNPIHLDDAAARAAGLPGVVVMGMLPAGLLGRLAADWLGLEQLEHFSVRFRRPIWPGEPLDLEARVEELDEESVELALALEVDGEVRIDGRASGRVGSRSGASEGRSL